MQPIQSFVAIALAAVFTSVGSVSATAADDRAESAQELLESVLATDKGPGIAATLNRDGRILWSGAAGLADLEWRQVMSSQTRARIGSVSKPFTAVLALKLSEAKRLKLDEPLSISGWGSITPRQLATHTSGLRHYDFANFAEANNMAYYSDLSTALEPFKNQPPLSEPGAAFHYSSIGFNVLGAVSARAFGGTFGDALTALVTQPLGLDDTLPNDALTIIPRRARGYTIAAQNPIVPRLKDGELVNTIYRDDSDLFPSGGLLSSAEDLAAFTQAVFETDFLSPKSRNLVTHPAKLANGDAAVMEDGKSRYAFGWMIALDEKGNVDWIGHNGETNGAYALVRYFPRCRLSLGALVNYNVMAAEPAFFEKIGRDLPALFAGDCR